MNKIIYDKTLLRKYDSTFDKNYLFIEELKENESYKIIKHTRKVIEHKNISRYIYNSTLDLIVTQYGYLLKTCDDLFYLNKVGDNIYYLSYIECKNKLALYSILHTFILKYNCYIDVTKYSYLFDDFENIYLHKQI